MAVVWKARVVSTLRDGATLMPNKPRPENRHRMVRVEDELWEAAKVACAKLGTTRAAVMREALQRAVEEAAADKRRTV